MRSCLHLTRRVLALAVLASAPQQAQDQWATADRETRRLSPSAFHQLPAPVRVDLERRGCTVPQTWTATALENVISGHFRSGHDIDWAVLCSVDRVSSILVYWAGQADSVDVLGARPDSDYLQGIGDDRIGFSRGISPVDSAYIQRHFEWYGGPTPPPLDHSGIDDAFSEKGSRVWYWHDGKWLQLAGAD